MKPHFTIPIVLVLLLSACLSSRKAKDKACAQADALMAKAVMKCPEILVPQLRTDTIILYTEPKASAGERSYTQAHMDSLATLCSNILATYRDQAKRIDAADSVRIAQLTARLRTNLCEFPTITEANNQLLLKIWSEKGKVRYWYNVLPQKVQQVVTTPTRTISTHAPCPPAGVAPGWRTYALVLTGLLVLGFVIIILIALRSQRHIEPRG